MNVLARFSGLNGEITIIEKRATGARIYYEAGVYQSYVLPGGEAGLDYVRLMTRVLEGAPDILLFGCGGGALASELYRSGSRVEVADYNAISFEIARKYFWMPQAVVCATEDIHSFLQRTSHCYLAIGVDVGGPCFEYESVIDTKVCALLRQRLSRHGRIAINIACDPVEDKTPDRIASKLIAEEFEVWICDEENVDGRNAVIVATSKGDLSREAIDKLAVPVGYRVRRPTL